MSAQQPTSIETAATTRSPNATEALNAFFDAMFEQLAQASRSKGKKTNPLEWFHAQRQEFERITKCHASLSFSGHASRT